MPRYLISNTSRSSVPLPPPLQGTIRPQSNVTIDTEATNMDTPLMRDMLNKGILRIAQVAESPRISSKIEIPVVDLMAQGSVLYRETWQSGTTYYANDLVAYAGQKWLALQTCTGISPVEGSYWTSFGAGDGITETEHATLRQLAHLAEEGGPWETFASGVFQEALPFGDAFPTTITWWESAAKLKKIVEEVITYTGSKQVATDQWKVYEEDGTTVRASFTDTYSYAGAFFSSRTRTIP